MYKTYHIIFYIVFLFLLSCEDDVPSIGAVPSSFTKKVLIEEFTGSWCGYCPDGADRLKNIIDEQNGNVIGVSLHSGDAMEIEHTNFLGSTYQNPGFPSGMVDRISFDGVVSMNRGYWDYISSMQLETISNCGLAIKSSLNGENANIDIHVGFNEDLNIDYRLNVYLIEDKVTGSGYGYDQSNYYNEDSSSSFYGLGNPIEGYEHNYTLRAVLTPEEGENIDPSTMVVGGEYISTYKKNISAYNKGNLRIIAFINFHGDTYLEHEIINVQECSIDGLKDWD